MSHPYSNMDIESEPSVEDVEQVEANTEIPVTLRGPIRTQELPSRIGVSRSIHLPEATIVPILGADSRRKRVTLIAYAPSGSTSTAVFIGPQENTGDMTESFRLPYGVPVILENTESLYAMVQGSGLAGTHHLSIYAENLAD